MKTNFNNSIKRFITVLMICIIGVLILNKSQFIHNHELADGKIITHSHPYNKSNDSDPFKNHNHKKAEFLFFENLEILFPLSPIAVVFLQFTKKAKQPLYRASSLTPVCILIPPSRAPPVF